MILGRPIVNRKLHIGIAGQCATALPTEPYVPSTIASRLDSCCTSMFPNLAPLDSIYERKRKLSDEPPNMLATPHTAKRANCDVALDCFWFFEMRVTSTVLCSGRALPLAPEPFKYRNTSPLPITVGAKAVAKAFGRPNSNTVSPAVAVIHPSSY